MLDLRNYLFILYSLSLLGENVLSIQSFSLGLNNKAGPRRGGPAVWDPACMLMVPCSSRGGYHVGGDLWHAMRPTLWLSWGARVRSVASRSQ